MRDTAVRHALRASCRAHVTRYGCDASALLFACAVRIMLFALRESSRHCFFAAYDYLPLFMPLATPAAATDMPRALYIRLSATLAPCRLMLRAFADVTRAKTRAFIFALITPSSLR